MPPSIPSPIIPFLPSPLVMLLMVVLPILAAVLLPSKKKKIINAAATTITNTTAVYPLPPSPRKIPIIGNLHQLGSFPHRSLRALSDRHGPLMLLHLGSFPVLVASSPSAVREITQTHDHLFANRPQFKAPTTIFYRGRDIAFAPYGEYWRVTKKAAVFHLLSTKKVEIFKHAREEEVAFMLKNIKRTVAVPLDITELFNALSRDVISRAVVGEATRGVWWGTALRRIIEESSRLAGEFYVGDYIPWLGMIGGFVNGFNWRVRTAFETADELLEGIVAEHKSVREKKKKKKKKKGGDGGIGIADECFLDVLLSLEEELNARVPFDKESIKAIVKDMFGAGTDSTSISMEWTMAELVRHPTAMKKLKEDITKVIGTNKTFIKEDDLVEMSYLKAVIKEALRLHPPGPLLVPHQLMEDTCIILGYRIPKGAVVLVNVWAIGRDPEVWDSPEEYRPERFISGEGREINFTNHEFKLLPFGSGRRACPGIQFSMRLIELAIANLVHVFDWKPAKGRIEDMDMGEVYGLTTRKRGGLLLMAIKAVKQKKDHPMEKND